MPSNQQRREAAKRKLERQLVRRQEKARSRRQRYYVVGTVAAVLVAAGVVWLVTSRDSGTGTSTAADESSTTSTAPATPCSYPTENAAPAAKKVDPPSNLSPESKGTVQADVTLNGTTFPITLNRQTAPCAVNSFLLLAAQGFYDNTDCWRLTASPGLNVLQCGDPSGKGTGGPGYTFDDEVTGSEKYPAGTIAMANAGSGTSGSQFFIAYKDIPVLSGYTVLGTVSAEGMKVVDEIAAKGVTDNRQDGKPIAKATIEKVTVPQDAVTATGSYPSATPESQQSPSEPAGSGSVVPSGSLPSGSTPAPSSAG